MKINDVKEWLQIADEDLFSAQLLNKEIVRKPNEIICYHCAQAIEKYLKGFLTYNEITLEKKHNLLLLLDCCIGKDETFETIRTECGILNKFANEIRYPHRIEVKIEDVNYSLNAVERIRVIEPLKKLREILENTEGTDKK